LRRFFVDKIIPGTGFVSITGKEARHIRNVLRMKKGEMLILMDREGQSFEATIGAIHYKEVKVKINKSISPLPPSPISISSSGCKPSITICVIDDPGLNIDRQRRADQTN